MDARDIAKKEFIERMVSEGGLNPKFLEHKCAYNKLADIVGKYVKLVDDEYRVSVSPSELVKNGCIFYKEATAKTEGGCYEEKRQTTFMSIDDENMLHETLNIKEQNEYGDGKYHLNEYNRESIYNQEGMEIEEEEKNLSGGVSRKPVLNKALGDETPFYDMSILLNDKEQLSKNPITMSEKKIKRTNEMVTAVVERKEEEYTAHAGIIKKQDAGYIKLADTRSSYGLLHGVVGLIPENKKIKECTISLPQDPNECQKEVNELRRKYVEYEPDGVVSQAIMRQELEKKVGKEKLAEISKSGTKYMQSAYQKLQDLQRGREDNQMEI